LLAGNDQLLVTKALSNLIPGSVPHNYLYFVNQLTRLGGIQAEDQTTFQKFIGTKHSQEAMQLKLWDLLRRFDATTDEATRKQILESLCDDYLHFNFDHQKP
jgi:hypothetical protein